MQSQASTTKEKDNSIRPAGFGEWEWWIIGKTITGLLKEDIIHVAGTPQTCVGLKSSMEAPIHSVRKSFQDKNSECLLLVDAEYAFNKLNRKVSLENIKRLCSLIYTYFHNNSYNTPAMLYLENRSHIYTVTGRFDTRFLFGTKTHKKTQINKTK